MSRPRKTVAPHQHTHNYPAWATYLFDNRIRAWFHNPARLLGRYIAEGDTAADIGSGRGIFTIGMARLVGERGRVIAVDYHKGLLEMVQRRAEKAGVINRIIFHQCEQDDINLNITADFAISFWMVHEVPFPDRFFRQVHEILKPNGKYLVTEPKLHVSARTFQMETEMAKEAGFQVIESPQITFSHAVVLGKR